MAQSKDSQFNVGDIVRIARSADDGLVIFGSSTDDLWKVVEVNRCSIYPYTICRVYKGNSGSIEYGCTAYPVYAYEIVKHEFLIFK